MKITPILVQFLLNNKHLSLPGIGRFTISKNGKTATTDHPREETPALPDITFTSNPSEKNDESLIDFIAKESGKMKSLAAADLESYIGLAREILFSGKSFQLEGVGNLLKTRNDQFEFSTESIIAEKGKETAAELLALPEESFSNYNRILLKRKQKDGSGKKALTAMIILVGIALAVWGGYSIYKKNLNSSGISQQSEPVESNQPNKETSDSSAYHATGVPEQIQNSKHTYRFIIEQAGLSRVLTRYNQLKSYKLNVKMGTSDSAVYKVFFEIAALPADTQRIADSLTFLYKLKGEKKVWAE